MQQQQQQIWLFFHSVCFQTFFFFARTSLLYIVATTGMCTHILTFSAKCLYASAGGPLKELDDFYSTPLSLFNRNKQTGRGSNLAGPPQIKMFEKRKEQRYYTAMQYRVVYLCPCLSYQLVKDVLFDQAPGWCKIDRQIRKFSCIHGKEKQLCNSGCQHLNLKKKKRKKKKKDGL